MSPAAHSKRMKVLWFFLSRKNKPWMICGAAMLSLMQPIAASRAADITPVIVDTDVGDDIDDAFALALLLRSPELRIEGITTSFGDTALRTRLVRRLVHQAGRDDITVATGPATPDPTRFTQASWATTEPATPSIDAVSFLLDRLRAAPPGTITLIALAPLTTIGRAIQRDPAAFGRLRRVVMMGGSIRRGYGHVPGTTSGTPSVEYNVRSDPADLRRLIASGVPLTLMPLDATEIALPRDLERKVFAEPDPLDRALAALDEQWVANNPWGPVPVLFDVVPVAALLDPQVCRPVPIGLDVTDSGATIERKGGAPTSVCLGSDRAEILRVLAGRLAPAVRPPARRIPRAPPR